MRRLRESAAQQKLKHQCVTSIILILNAKWMVPLYHPLGRILILFQDNIPSLLWTIYVMPKSHTFQHIQTNHHNLSCLLIYIPRYSFLSLWVASWSHLVHEFELYLSQQLLRAGKMIYDVGCWRQFWFCHCWACLVLSLLNFHWFQQNSFFINSDNSYCNSVDMAYNNHSEDDIHYYAAINIYNSNHCPVLAKIKSPWCTHQSSPPSCIPRSLSKRKPEDGFATAWGRNNPEWLPHHIFNVRYRNFIPFYSTWMFIEQGQHNWQITQCWLAMRFLLNEHSNIWKPQQLLPSV